MGGLPNKLSYHAVLTSKLAQLTCANMVFMDIPEVSVGKWQSVYRLRRSGLQAQHMNLTGPLRPSGSFVDSQCSASFTGSASFRLLLKRHVRLVRERNASLLLTLCRVHYDSHRHLLVNL